MSPPTAPKGRVEASKRRLDGSPGLCKLHHSSQVGGPHLRDVRKLLPLVRRYTGDHFTPRNGYHAGRPLNFGQRMAILRYAEKIEELISKPFVTYRPKRGEKTEAFSYTGQKGFRYFDKAIIHKPDPEAELEFRIDRTRPRGSRFVPTNRKTGQRFYHIPPEVFLDIDLLPTEFIEWLIEQGEDLEEIAEEVLFEYLIEWYAQDAEMFLIQAGESYMWGAAGSRDAVAEKIQTIINNYGPSLFNANDRKSSYYGNWFRGVTGFTNRFDAFPMIAEAQRKKRERMEKYKLKGDKKWRRLKDGSFGLFEGGRLVERMYLSGT